MPIKTTRVAGGPAASLIHSRMGWLLDLSASCGFDLSVMRNAARQCNRSGDCGIPLPPTEIEQLVGDLAQAQGEPLMIAGGPAAMYRLGTRTVFRFGHDRNIGDVLGQFSAVPPGGEVPTGPTSPTGTQPLAGPEIPCCPGCGRCMPGQCEGPPPPPTITITEFESCDCDAVCAARKDGALPANCPCDRECKTCP